MQILQHKNSTIAAQKRRREWAVAWFVNENLTPQAARRRRPPCKYPYFLFQNHLYLLGFSKPPPRPHCNYPHIIFQADLYLLRLPQAVHRRFEAVMEYSHSVYNQARIAL